MAVQQHARFCNIMRLVQEHASKHITQYYASMYAYVDLTDRNWQLTTRGVVYNTNIGKGIECYIDANFTGGLPQADSNNAENIMSRTGYVIT